MAQQITHNPPCCCYYNLHKTHAEFGYLSYTQVPCVLSQDMQVMLKILQTMNWSNTVEQMS